MSSIAPGRRPAGLARIGSFCARHPGWVLAAWLVLLVAALGGRKAVGPVFGDQVTLPGTQSDTGAGLLAASDPAADRPDGLVVASASTTRCSPAACRSSGSSAWPRPSPS